MSSSSQPPIPKKNKGRQKVKMEKMENQSNLQVTFSKRRAGLFKKASELCTLCGAQAAIVVFSPADKVYCFGHPNVESILDRFAAADADDGPTAGQIPTNNHNNINSTNQMIIEAHRNSTIRELNLELTHVESLLRAKRSRTEELEMMKRAGRAQKWYPPSLDEFNYEQLCVLKESILGFKKKFDEKVEKDMMLRAVAAAAANNPPLPNFQYPHQENPNPRGFPIPIFNINNDPFSMGSYDFSANSGGIGIGNNSGMFAAQASNNNHMISGNNSGMFVAQASNDHNPMISGNNSGIFAAQASSYNPMISGNNSGMFAAQASNNNHMISGNNSGMFAAQVDMIGGNINSGMFAAQVDNNNHMISGNINSGLIPWDYVRGSSDGLGEGSSFFGGGTNNIIIGSSSASSSRQLPNTDPMMTSSTIGSRGGFGMYNYMGYDPRMF